MRFLSTYGELRLYRNKQFLLDPPNRSKLKYGTKLTVLSDDKDDIPWLFNTGMVSMMYTNSIYVEKKIYVKLIQGGLVQRLNSSQMDTYKFYRRKMPFIRFTFQNLTQYDNKNIIYDASDYLGILYSKRNMTSSMYLRQAYAMLDMIHSDVRFNDYGKKYYFVKIDGSTPPINNQYLLRTSIHSLNQALFYRLLYEPETMKDYLGSTFIIRNTTGLFTYFTFKTEHIEKGIPRLWKFLKGMYAYAKSDAAGIKEIAGDIDKEQDSSSSSDSSGIEGKFARFIENFTDSSVMSSIKSSFVKNMDDVDDSPVIKSTPDKGEALDDAINDLKSADKKIQRAKEGLPPQEDESDKKDKSSESKMGSIIDTASKMTSKAIKDIKKKEKNEDNTHDDNESDDAGSSPNNPKEAEDKLGSEEESNSDTSKKAKEALAKTLKEAQQPTRSPEQEKRIKTLKEKFPNIKLDNWEGDGENKTVGDMIKEFEDTTFENPTIPAKTTNKSLQHASLQNMQTAYYNKTLDDTILQIMQAFADNPEIHLILTDASKKDISTTLDAMYQYTFHLEDEFGKKHTVVYDVPKLIDKKFFLLGGTKQMINNQITLLPVVKYGNNLVHFSTAHNEMDISRFGKVFDARVASVIKLATQLGVINPYGIEAQIGNSYKNNSNYETTLEYNEISKSIYSITIKGKKTVSFQFDQHRIRQIIEDLAIPYKEVAGKIPVAISDNKTVWYIRASNGKDYESGKYTLSDMIFSAIEQYSSFPNIQGYIAKINAPSTYMYTRAHYINRMISIGVLMSYLWGFKTLLKNMGVKYTIWNHEDKDNKPKFNATTQNKIKFKDCTVFYDIYPLRHSLILNGIAAEMITSKYNIDEMDGEIPYLETFDELFQTRQMAKGYIDFKHWMMDPITVKIQKELGLPYKLFDVLLYANSMLEDDHMTDVKNFSINRIRNYELIPVYMYKSLVRSYTAYKYKYNKKNTKFITHRKDIINSLMHSRLLNEYDTVNPIREVESQQQLTFKGPGGCNVDDAYTLARRAYDRSMLGVAAASTPSSSSAGITKYAAMNPRITNTLGFVKTGNDEDSNELEMGNLGSPGELLTPFAIDHDSPERLSFITKESKHLMPTHKTDPLLIGNGMEKTFPYMVSNDFITIAKQDGKVLDVDKKNGIAVVEYKDGSKESIDIKTRPHYDGGMGFYIISEKTFDLKPGDKFKKDTALVKNPAFFSSAKDGSSPQYNPGTLSKVALMMSSGTHEDSALITDNISEKMASDVVFCKNIVLGAKSKIYEYKDVDDTFEVGEPLMVFDEELDDEEINAIIKQSELSKDSFMGLESAIKKQPKAKVSGVVQDIRVYYTVPYDEMSESVKALCKKYDDRLKARKKLISKYGATNPNEVLTDYIGVTTPSSGDKIAGVYCPTGKVLVQIYEKYVDRPSSGDKIVFYASMKATVQKRLPMSKAPYPVGKKDSPIDAVLSPISVNARMVMSIMMALYGNKMVIGLKDRVRDIFNKYATNEKLTKPAEISTGIEKANAAANESVSIESIMESFGFDVSKIQDIINEYK